MRRRGLAACEVESPLGTCERSARGGKALLRETETWVGWE